MTIPERSSSSFCSDKVCKTIVSKLQDIIGTDAGGRGMKHLIVEGDLVEASHILASLASSPSPTPPTVVILSGFPCCVDHTPPTETDGPPGAYALARTCLAFGYRVVMVVEDCHQSIFAAASQRWIPDDDLFELTLFPSDLSQNDEQKLEELANACDLLLSCERAGDAQDGLCYTMRGIDMNARGLISPKLNRRMVEVVQQNGKRFLAIGDGGNELGMGKVWNKIREHIPKGNQIGCVISADCLIAASVSNWGGYALAAGAAVMKGGMQYDSNGDVGTKSQVEQQQELKRMIEIWIERCVPTEQEEIDLLQRCVDVGCRDGVSGKIEATVDGMPLETSMKCLRDIREACLDLDFET